MKTASSVFFVNCKADGLLTFILITGLKEIV